MSPSIRLLFVWLSASLAALSAEAAADYGVDCSFPIHSREWGCGDLLGNRTQIYNDFMDGCRAHLGAHQAHRCDATEDDRLAMSVRQPMSMVNYTSTGYKKVRAPPALFDLLLAHWENNQHMKKAEVWFTGNTYTNHWESPSYMVSVEDTKLRGGGAVLKQKLWDTVKRTIEEWTGMEQKPTSMYGIREYTNNAVLSPHVDRLPLVSSCIVNVAQDIDEDWPLKIYDREGKGMLKCVMMIHVFPSLLLVLLILTTFSICSTAVNVTMKPGDMVLYESGSLIHGRPFPLVGRSYASIFIHFEPTGRKLGDTSNQYLETLDDFFPPYLGEGSPEMDHWAANNPGGWRKPVPSAPNQLLSSPEAHNAAALGDVDRLAKLAKSNKGALKKKDANGWHPIHEATRAGHTDAVKILLQHGENKDARTGHSGKGGSVLNLALAHLDEEHDLVQYLRSIGANDFEQEL